MKKGFTLVELISVILILGVLAVIAIPTYINTSNSIKSSNLESIKKMISTTMLNYATTHYLDDIKPANNTCAQNNCCKYYSVKFIKENNIFQTTSGSIVDPVTNLDLEGYVKVSYDTNALELKSEFKENKDDIGNCEVVDYIDEETEE